MAAITSTRDGFKTALEALASCATDSSASPTSFISIYIPAGVDAQAAWGARLKQETGTAKNIKSRV